jgi:hypothetical protein
LANRLFGLTDSIRKFIKSQDRVVSIQEIYQHVSKDRDLQIHSENEEVRYDRPRWQHSVRRAVLHLVRKGEVRWLGEGRYIRIGSKQSRQSFAYS